MRNCIEIKSDVFDIAKRLREIDRGYFVVYNIKMRRFEVHNRQQKGGSFCLALPYPCLDVRTITLVCRTRSERAAAVLAELESENLRNEKAAIYNAGRDAEREAERICSRLGR